LSHRSAQSIKNQAATLCDLCDLRWPGLSTLQTLVCPSYRAFFTSVYGYWNADEADATDHRG